MREVLNIVALAQYPSAAASFTPTSLFLRNTRRGRRGTPFILRLQQEGKFVLRISLLIKYFHVFP
jgi:hypothetical protein